MVRAWFAAAVLAALAMAVVRPAGAGAGAPGVPVLMYHKVDAHVPAGPVGRSLTIDPAVFAAQLAWLRTHHIRTLTMAELVNDLRRGRPPAGAVVLTFDDGYSDAAEVVTPLLRRYGARASFYISAGFVGDGRHMTWAQMRAMRAAGMEIGCHGTHHLDLAVVRPSQAAYEVNHCVETLAHYLARPTTYAYPAGKWNATTLALMRLAGISAALTERPGTVTSLAQPYTLPRRRISRADSLAQFAALARP